MNNYDWNLIKKNDFDWNIPYGCIFDYLQVCEESSKNDEKFKTYASKDFNIHIEEEIRSTHTNYIFYGTKK